MRTVPVFRRVLSLALCASLILDVSTVSAWADFWQGRRAARTPATGPQLASLGTLPPLSSSLTSVIRRSLPSPAALPSSSAVRALAARVPAARASVVEISEGNAAVPPVVILQDIHLNAEAQENSAAALQALVADGGVRVVGLEGAFGAVDLSRFRSFPDRKALAFVTDAFLKAGALGASSYLAVNQPDAFKLVGVDDRAHYEANARAVVEGARARSQSERALADARRTLEKTKARLFKPALRRFDTNRSAWSRGDLGIGEYLASLATMGAASPKAVDDFLQAYTIEKRLDFKRVEAQRRSILEALTRKLDADGLTSLLTSALAYKSGEMGMGDYHRGLINVSRKAGVDLEAYPDFESYVRYVGLAERINAERLFAAVSVMEENTEGVLAVTPEERATLHASAQLDRAAKLVKFSLTPTEWAAYGKERDSLASLSSALAPFEAFYAEAEIRSRGMVEALLAEKSSGARVLVTGGYHAPEMRALLQARGCPVLVLSPRLTRVDGDPTAYLGVFSREKTPLDRLFAGEKLFLNPVESTVAYPPTARRLQTEALLKSGEALPVGQSQSSGGVTYGHPEAGLTHAKTAELEVWGSPSSAGTFTLRSIGTRLSGGFLLVPRWTFKAVSGNLNFTRVARALAGFESVLKAVALTSLLAMVAPAIGGPAALLTPLGILALSVASFALTLAWMGSHALMDTVRTLFTGNRYERNWRVMWHGAVLLNVVAVIAMIGVAAAGLTIGADVSPSWAYGAVHGIGHVIMNGFVGAAGALSVVAEKDTRKSPTATDWVEGDFRGVDLEHFVHAQNRLAAGQLDDTNPADFGPGTLSGVLKILGLTRLDGKEDNYAQIFEALANGRCEAVVIDMINGNTYSDPRLDKTISKQSSNPLTQSVFEAVSNGLDALLPVQRGQFGKGVKQVIDWLEPSGRDSVEVVTRRKAGTAGKPVPRLRLLIRQDAGKRNFIQMTQLSGAEIRMGFRSENGTSVRITTARSIPRTVEEEGSGIVSQERIIDGIKRRFPFIRDANIVLRQAGKTAEEINGFSRKRILVPAGEESAHKSETNNVIIEVDDHSILIEDNGKGMSAKTLGGMFVPDLTSKTQEKKTAENIEEEILRSQFVHDTGPNVPNRISFARFGEVVFSVDIPNTIVGEAVVPGGLMIDLAVKVPPDRKNLILPTSAKFGEPTNFTRGIMHVVNEVLKHPEASLSAEQKLKLINTLVVGLEELIQGNSFNKEAVAIVRAEIQAAIKPVIRELRDKGVIILPHDASFGKLRNAASKPVLYLNENLFDWSGASALKAMGGEVVPDITLGGDEALPLVVVPFQQFMIDRVSTLHEDWHDWHENERLPVLRTKQFIAIPPELGGRFLALAKKRADGLTDAEQDEFEVLLRLINILTSSKVKTGYSTSTSPLEKNAVVAAARALLSRSVGQPDSLAANNVLARAPVILKSGENPTNLPADSPTRFIGFPKTGETMDLKFGKLHNLPGVKRIEPMKGNYYFAQGNTSAHTAVYEMNAAGELRFVSARYDSRSPGGRFAYGFNGTNVNIFDTETDQTVTGENMPISVGFSEGDRYQISIRKSPDGTMVIERKDFSGVDPTLTLPAGKYESIEVASDGFCRVRSPDNGTAIVDFSKSEVIPSNGYVEGKGRFCAFKGPDGMEIRFWDGRVITEKKLGFSFDSMQWLADGGVRVRGKEPNEIKFFAPVSRYFMALTPASTERPKVDSQSGTLREFRFRGEIVGENHSVNVDLEKPFNLYGTAPNGVQLLVQGTYVLREKSGAEIPLAWTESSHSASFDGRYFVFSPNAPGPVYLIDPDHPKVRIKIEPRKPESEFSDIPPAELDGSYQIVHEPGEFIQDAAGNKIRAPNEGLFVKRWGQSTFEIQMPDGSIAIAHVRDGKIQPENMVELKGEESLIGEVKHFLVYRLANGWFQTFNTKTGVAARMYQEVAISPSGKFMVGRMMNKLVLLAVVNGQLQAIKEFSAVERFRMSPSADVLEVTISGIQETYFLTPNGTLPAGWTLDTVEIDDSGLFGLSLKSKKIVFLQTGEIFTWAKDATYRLGIGTTQEHVFLRLPGGNRYTFDRKTGKPVATNPEWPPFFRVYDLGFSEIGVSPGYPHTATSIKPIDTANSSRFEGSREQLIGDFLVRRTLVTSIENPDAIYTFMSDPDENVFADRNLRYLEKNRIIEMKNEIIHFPLNGPPVTYKKFGPGFSTDAGAKVLFHTNGGYMLVVNGETRLLGFNEIPAHFTPTDAIGDSFVFSDTSGNVVYARFSGKSKEQDTSDATIEKWNEEVLSQRDRVIADLRSAWQPLWDAIPEIMREGLLPDLKTEIAELYQQDDAEIHRRFADAVKKGTRTDLSAPLPSEQFRRRMQAMAPALRRALGQNEQVAADEERDRRRAFKLILGQDDAVRIRQAYRTALTRLFGIARNEDIPIGNFTEDTYRMIALGFNPAKPADIETARIIAGLIAAMVSLGGARLGVLAPLVRFLATASARGTSGEVIREQVERVASANPEFVRLLIAALENSRSDELLSDYANRKPGAYEALGDLSPFAVFLINRVNRMRNRKYELPDGVDRENDPQGVSLAVLQLLENARPKSGKPGEVMTVAYLLERLSAAKANLEKLPVPELAQEASLRNKAEVQREPGAYASEVPQNSIDAGSTELALDFYTRTRDGVEESVEEMKDNGSGALQEIALDILASTKEAEGQKTKGGFFGSGKFTIFRGVDRVEIISRNKDRSYLFEYEVDRDSLTGEVTGIRKTRIRELTNPSGETGVTIRRIKLKANTIPELDQMVSLRNWKTFAGLSQKGNFRITVPVGDPEQGKREQMKVESEVVASMPYVDEKGINWGDIRLISTKDMPLQVVTGQGLRSKTLGEDFLALIPGPLRKHVEEMGLNIEVPLPLNESRSGFDHENIRRIQQHVAILFFQVIAKRSLSVTSPLIFDGLSDDWETNPAYTQEFTKYSDREIINLANAINEGKFSDVDAALLTALRVPEGQLDKAKRFVKLILLLKVPVATPAGVKVMSAFERRKKLWEKIDAERADREARMVGQTDSGDVYVPNEEAKLRQAARLEQARHINPDDFLFQADNADQQARHDWVLAEALKRVAPLGIRNVVFVQDRDGVRLPFDGLFRFGDDTLFLHERITKIRNGTADVSSWIEILVHELSHGLEARMHGQRFGWVIDVSGLTHDQTGTFAEGQKYAAAILLKNHSYTAFQAANMEWLRRGLVAIFGERFMTRGWYNGLWSWIAEGGFLLIVGAAIFVFVPGLDFRTVYDLVWIGFPALHLIDFAFSGNRKNAGQRFGASLLLSVVMLAMPAGMDPGMLLALSFAVHGIFNNVLAVSVKVISLVRKNGIRAILPKPKAPPRVGGETREQTLRRLTSAVKAFVTSQAATGGLSPGMTRVMDRVVASLPDGQVRVSDLDGRGGRLRLHDLLTEDKFEQGDFVAALRIALKDEVRGGNVSAKDYLPLLRELAAWGVPAESTRDLVEDALVSNRKMTIVVTGATDEKRVLELLDEIRTQLLTGEQNGRTATVELVVPPAERARFALIATRWKEGLKAAGRTGNDLITVEDQPVNLIEGAILNLQNLPNLESMKNGMLMVPNTLTVNTAGVRADILAQLLIATLEITMSARVMSGQTLSNLATLAAVVARQA